MESYDGREHMGRPADQMKSDEKTTDEKARQDAVSAYFSLMSLVIDRDNWELAGNPTASGSRFRNEMTSIRNNLHSQDRDVTRMDWAGQYAMDMQKALREGDPRAAKQFQESTLKSLADADIPELKSSPRYAALVESINGYQKDIAAKQNEVLKEARDGFSDTFERVRSGRTEAIHAANTYDEKYWKCDKFQKGEHGLVRDVLLAMDMAAKPGTYGDDAYRAAVTLPALIATIEAHDRNSKDSDRLLNPRDLEKLREYSQKLSKDLNYAVSDGTIVVLNKDFTPSGHTIPMKTMGFDPDAKTYGVAVTEHEKKDAYNRELLGKLEAVDAWLKKHNGVYALGKIYSGVEIAGASANDLREAMAGKGGAAALYSAVERGEELLKGLTKDSRNKTGAQIVGELEEMREAGYQHGKVVADALGAFPFPMAKAAKFSINEMMTLHRWASGDIDGYGLVARTFKDGVDLALSTKYKDMMPSGPVSSAYTEFGKSLTNNFMIEAAAANKRINENPNLTYSNELRTALGTAASKAFVDAFGKALQQGAGNEEFVKDIRKAVIEIGNALGLKPQAEEFLRQQKKYFDAANSGQRSELSTPESIHRSTEFASTLAAIKALNLPEAKTGQDHEKLTASLLLAARRDNVSPESIIASTDGRLLFATEKNPSTGQYERTQIRIEDALGQDLQANLSGLAQQKNAESDKQADMRADKVVPQSDRSIIS